MEITEIIERYWIDYVISLISAFITYVIAPRLGITDSNLVFAGSCTIFFVVAIVIYLVFQPAIEFEFSNRKRALILVKNSVDSRTSDFSLDVGIKPKCSTLKNLFSMTNDDLAPIFYQIIWSPKKSLQIKKNQDYSALSTIEGYPAIQISQLLPTKDLSYSFRVSFTNSFPEICENNLKIRRYTTDKLNFKTKLFLWFFKAKTGVKPIIIQRES